MFGNRLIGPFGYLLISLLLFSQAKSIFASDYGSDYDSKKTNHLHFVTFIEPPYIFDKKETDKKGLVEIVLDKLMENIGIKYDIIILPAKRAEITARTTPNTCILPIERIQEREVFFSWISPVIISKHGFFSMPHNDYILLNTMHDAYTYRVGSYLGSGVGEHLESLNYKVDFATQNEANIYKLKINRIDLWASDVLSAQYISKHTAIEITQSKLDFFTTLRGIGCHLDVDDAIIKKMRKQLQIMYRNGSLFTTIQKFKADSFNTNDFNTDK